VKPRHIAIVGGGYSGIIQAVNLLRFGDLKVTLIERAGQVARGAAYSTRHADHLLNVRAGKMSALADSPDHFAEWLSNQGLGGAADFAERRVYGRYLEELFGSAAGEAGEQLRVVEGEAVSVTRDAEGEDVHLANGQRIEADAVILSVGNLAPERPRSIPADLDEGIYVADPWAGDIAEDLGDGDHVLLIGTGLTAIDAALMLDASGFKGRIFAISRRGLLPHAHDATPHSVPALAEAPSGELSSMLGAVRRRGAEIGWQSAVDQLRPHTQAFWAGLPVERRKRFLRHLRPWWDVHRHRIAPQIGARIAAMEKEGRLSRHAGKLVSVEPAQRGAEVTWRPRGSDTPQSLKVRRIVNCTGPQGNLARSGEALLTQLLEEGRIRPDPCGIGIDIDGGSHALNSAGRPSDSLYAIGPMTRGALWEIVAVPDIREQTYRLAKDLSQAS
jgi:uncharacterized NAD(P)/FAD-binding protein YdhS